MISTDEQSQQSGIPLRSRRIFAAAVVAAALSLPSLSLSADAETISWTGAADGNWFNAANWSPAQVPASADAVVIDSNTTVSVSGATSIAFATLVLGDAAGNFAPTLRLSAAQSTGGAVTIHRGAKLQQDTNQQIVFGALNVLPGGMLTHTANSSARSFLINLSVAGDFDLQAGATIAASGLGYAGGLGYQAPGFGPGAGLSSSGVGGGGAHGGAGGKSSSGDAGGSAYDSATNPLDLGSGGAGSYTNGRGGAGGGAVLIEVGGAFSLNGQINANGGAGTASGSNYGAGGGAGGTVNITAAAFNGTGSVLANGSAGVTAGNFGGGGGGGRIAVVVTGTDASNLNLQANGGAGGGGAATSGGAGVIALKTSGGINYNLSIGDTSFTPQSVTAIAGSTPTFSTATLNNSIVSFDAGSVVTINNLVVSGVVNLTAAALSINGGVIHIKNGGILRLTAQSISGGHLLVDGGGAFQQMNALPLGFASVLVLPGGMLTHAPNTSARSSVLNLNVTGDFDLQPGATIAASGLGYAGGLGYQAPGFGPGGGLSSSGVGGGGAHGGSGGKSNAGDAGGAAYDSATNPLDLGSGGAGSYTNGRGGAGGGAVLIAVGGAFSLNGQINANGGAGTASGSNYGAGGGAGGTVNITAAAFNGTGSVLANGSAGVTAGNFGGGGGGGRIAVVVTGTDASNLNLQANGGTGGGAGATSGGAGVIALKTTGGVNYSLSIGDLTAVPQAGSGVGGTAPEFSTVTLNNSIVNFDPGSNVTINSLVVVGGAALSGHNFSFGSASPIQVRSGGSLKVTANQLTVPAGSPIEVQGGGSLALAVGVNSGGALIVRGGGAFQQLNAQTLNFDSVLVEGGGLLTHAPNTSTRASVLNLNVTGDFDLQAGATIAASGLGYAGGFGYQAPGFGPGGGLSSSGVGGGGAHGGAGGKSNAGDAGGSAYDSATNPLDLGSGGAGSYTNGRGGAGGGAVLIAVGGAFSLNGQINVSGGAGTASGSNYGAGGGAGGTVNITAAAFNGTGSVLANGSAGVTAGNFGGGGGGGRVAVVVTGTDASNLNLQANGGTGGGAGALRGGAGVVARKGSAALYSLTIGDLSVTPQSITPIAGALPVFAAVTIGNSLVNFETGSTATIGGLLITGAATVTAARLASNTLEVASGAALQLNAQATNGSLQVNAGGVFRQMNAVPLDFASVVVLTGGVLTHAANSTARSSVVNLNVSGNFDLQAGATIAASGLGYAGGFGYQAPGFGPGGGLSSSGVGGGGAHGGAGGKSNAGDAGGSAYDSATNPLDLGSGGAGSYTNGRGGAGGGAVLIAVGGAFSLNGQINVSGGAGTASGSNYGAGGGAGGTVNITAAAFNGTGSVLANGSAGVTAGNFGGGGGGGIVALTGCNSELVPSGVGGGAAGGTGATAGGAGVFSPVVPGACPNAPPTPANLAVLSMGQDASGITFITATWDPAAQALSYVLQASTDSNFAGTVFVATSTVTTATVRGLTPDATYFLAVKAFNDIGFSNFSAAVSTLTPADLTAPQAPALTAASGRPAGVVAMSWQPSASGEVAAFYNVYRATEDFASTADLSPVLAFVSTTNATDLPPADGIYFYGITALDPSGNESPLSNRLSAASIHFANAPVSDLTATFHLEQKQIVLNWGAPSTGTPVSYAVYRTTFAASVVSPQDRLQSLNSLTFTDQPSLAIDATYYYRVTSLNAVSEESAPSNVAASVFDVHAPVIGFSGIADGQSTRFDVAPVVAIADFSPVVSTLTLNGQPFVASTTITGTFNQTVGEGGTASLSCSAGTILSFTSVWATSCGNPKNCGTCPLGGASCTVLYNNAQCGDVAPGCSKDGRLAITCGYKTTLTEPGAYILALKARDIFAHVSSASVSFTIDKSSPVIVLTSPLDGDLLNQNVVVVFSSTDDFTPAAQVVVTDELGAIVSSPYVISAEGARALKLTARDLAGNSSSAEAAFILDKTPPLAVSDLRVTADDAAVGVATLAWTAPHDSLSGLAGYALKTATFPINGANFASAQTILVSTSALDEGASETFVATVSTAQTGYFALKAVDAAGNLSALSNVAFLDLDGPALSGVSPAPGTVISRLTTFTLQASDLSGVARIVFSVDGVVLSTATAAPYRFSWNTLSYADGAHALRFDALDGAGTASSLALSYTLSYQPPPTPVVTAPPSNFTTFTATVTVAGTAEPGTTVQVLIDGFVLASALTSSDGSFSTVVTLPAQGSPLLTVLASDSKGTGTPISPIVINYNLTAPGAPSDLSAVPQPAGLVRLAWNAPAGKVPSFYRVYRSTHAAAFSTDLVPSASLRIKDSLNARTFDDLPALDGVYYYAVTALDASLNESGASDSAGAVSDRAVPTASLTFETAPPFGPGAKRLQLTLSKVLASPPLLLFRPLNQAPLSVSLAASSPTVWVGTLTVTSSMNSGLGAFSFQGSDFVGNVGTSLTNATALLDLTGPSGSIVLAPVSPVKAGAVDLSLSLTEAVPVAPQLAYVTAAGSTVPVTLSGGGATWTGSLNIVPGSDGLATFSLSATDALGNIGSALTSGGSFVIVTTAPGEPLFLRAIPQKAGAVRLSWSAPVSGTPASYSVYRDGARISSGIAPLADGSGLLVDHPADGTYAYAASAVDAAGNESPLSTPVSATAKSAPPDAPIGAAATFSAFGHIEVNWQAGSPDSTSYRVHRTSAASGSFASATFSALASTTPFVDTPSQNARYFYFITALDFAGNESVPSAPAEIIWDRAPPAITVAGVQEGFLYNRDVAPSFSATGSATAVTLSATLNAAPFESGSTVSVEGNHLLTVHAVNESNAGSTVTVHFTIDKTSPSVSILGIPSGTSLTAVLPQVTATDLHLGDVALTLDGAAYPQGTPISANGAHVFIVTARDLAGNVTVSSKAFSLNLPPSAPLNFTLAATEGAGATFTWGSPAANLAGYRFYKDGILRSQGLLSGLQFSDAAFALGAAHVYEVLAVDASGQDGARARISVPAVDFSLASYGVNLNGVQALTRGFFDTVQFQLVNTGAQSVLAGPAAVELISTATVFSGQAPSVSVPAGGTALMPAVVAVIPDMPDAPTLRATLTLPVGLGSKATVTKTFPLSARTPLGSPVELFAGPMIFGANAAVQVKFNNKGSAPLEIRTAVNSDLSVALATPQGTVLSQALLSQTANGAQPGPTGHFVSVAPGSSFLFDAVLVFVPEALGSSALLSASIGRTFNNLLGTAIQGTRTFEASQSIAGGTAPAYSATISADQPLYDQGSTVNLSGEARDTLGALVPGATVQVGVSVRGFVRGLSAKTNAAGRYSLAFDPAPTESGIYTLSASNPSVVSRIAQSSFTIPGFSFQYGSFSAAVVRDTTLPFTVSLINNGQTTLTDLAALVVSTTGVAGVNLTLNPASLPASLNGEQSAALAFTASSTADAPLGPVSFTVEARESNGFVRRMPVTLNVSAGAPGPSANPQAFTIGMNAGQTRVQTVVLKNLGTSAWTGLSLSPSALSWVTIQGNNNPGASFALGDVPPGGQVQLNLVVSPPLGLASQAFALNPLVTVNSSNATALPINALITITAGSDGGIIYNVINADKPRNQFGSGVPVPGAQVQLVSLDIAGLSFNAVVDANSVARFDSVPAGRYNLTAKSAGFSDFLGTETIQPGVTATREILLLTEMVSYTWSVTPTTIVDEYTMKLSMTFKTDVPAPAVVISPAVFNFDIPSEGSVDAQLTVTNLGLISAFDVELLSKINNAHLTIDMPYSTIPELKAGQTVTIPFRVALHSPIQCFDADISGSGVYTCAAGSAVNAVWPGPKINVNCGIPPSLVVPETPILTLPVPDIAGILPGAPVVQAAVVSVVAAAAPAVTGCTCSMEIEGDDRLQLGSSTKFYTAKINAGPGCSGCNLSCALGAEWTASGMEIVNRSGCVAEVRSTSAGGGTLNIKRAVNPFCTPAAKKISVCEPIITATPDTTITVIGEDPIIYKAGVPPGCPPQTFAWSLDPPSLGTLGEGTVDSIKFTPGAPGKGKITVSDTTQGSSLSQQADISVVELMLKTVTFAGDSGVACGQTSSNCRPVIPDGGTSPFGAPQWTAGSSLSVQPSTFPLTYTRGATMSVSPVFSIKPDALAGEIWIRASASQGTNDLSISERKIVLGSASSEFELPLTALAKPLLPHVDQFDLNTLWEISLDNKAHWIKARTKANSFVTTNRVYVTLDNPLLRPEELFQTVLHLATKGNATTPAEAAANSWAEFALPANGPPTVKTWNGKPLQYYGPGTQLTGCHTSSAGLLESAANGAVGSGNCASLMFLLRDVFAANKLKSAKIDIETTNPSEGFLVKDWDGFDTPGSFFPETPYQWQLSLCQEVVGTSIYGMVAYPGSSCPTTPGVYGDLTSKATLYGQNTAPPGEKAFGSHYIVQLELDRGFYDPSYGTRYGAAANASTLDPGPSVFESAAVSGYFGKVEHSDHTVDGPGKYSVRKPTPGGIKFSVGIPFQQ